MCLTFQDLPDEIDERENQLQDRLADIVRVGIPPRRGGSGKPIEFGSERLDFLHLNRRSGSLSARSSALDRHASRTLMTGSLHGHKSGANANGGHGPLTFTVI